MEFPHNSVFYFHQKKYYLGFVHIPNSVPCATVSVPLIAASIFFFSALYLMNTAVSLIILQMSFSHTQPIFYYSCNFTIMIINEKMISFKLYEITFIYKIFIPCFHFLIRCITFGKKTGLLEYSFSNSVLQIYRFQSMYNQLYKLASTYAKSFCYL